MPPADGGIRGWGYAQRSHWTKLRPLPPTIGHNGRGLGAKWFEDEFFCVCEVVWDELVLRAKRFWYEIVFGTRCRGAT